MESMSDVLFSSTLKGLLILGAAYLSLLRFQRASAAVRHWICSLAVLSLVLVPLIEVVIPAWSMPILPPPSIEAANVQPPSGYALKDNRVVVSRGKVVVEPVVSGGASPVSAANSAPVPAPVATPTVPSAATGRASDLPWRAIVFAFWLLGAARVLGGWLLQMRRIARLTRQGKIVCEADWRTLVDALRAEFGVRRHVTLVASGQVSMPMTWGFWRPVIVLPAEALRWAAERRRIVIAHEMAHIARRDYVMQTLAMLSGALHWFNPLVWRMIDTLAIERERACDDRVLALAQMRSSDYAANLLAISQAASTQWRGALAMGTQRRSHLAQRIRRILDVEQRRQPLRRSVRVGVLLLMVMVLPFSTVQFSRAQSQPIILSIAAPQGFSDALASAIARDFESAHPGVSVKFVDAAPVPDAADGLDTYFSAMQKLASSADVLAINGFNLGLSPLATRAGYLLDLAPYARSDSSLKADDFYPAMWRAYQWDNGLWGLPIGAQLVGLRYVSAAFDRANLPYPEGRWSLDDFANAVTKLAIRDKDNNVTFAGFANSGRIFREALWRSLMGTSALDESIIPNAPQFDKPEIVRVMETYHQLEQQQVISSDVSAAAMYAGTYNGKDPKIGFALLPGNKAVLLPDGLAVSAGTAQPELAYALVKFLTGREEINFGIPSLKRFKPEGFEADMQPVVEDALNNGLTYADLRLTDYLNAAWLTQQATTVEALQAVQIRVANELKSADGKKATLALRVEEPVAKILPSGKIALTFRVLSYRQPLPTQALWDNLIADFVANDPQVGAVNLQTEAGSVSWMAANSDCFYMPMNAVPSMTENSLLSLDPYLSADKDFDAEDLLGGALAAVQRDKKTYALPLTIDPIVLKYNPSRFSAANVPEPTTPWTAEAFTDALRALQPSSAGLSPYVDSGTGGTYLLVLMADFGGVPIDFRTDPVTLNFTDPATRDAIRQVLDLAKQGYLKYVPLGPLFSRSDSFPVATTAIYSSQLSLIGRKIAAGSPPDKVVMFPMGRQFNGVAYQLGGAYISASSQNPDACYRFIHVLAQHPELFTAMPARRSLLQSPALQAVTPADVMVAYWRVAALLQDSRTVAFPLFDKGNVTLSALLVEHWLFEAFDSYVIDGGDLDAALKTAEGYAAGYLDCTAGLPAVGLISGGTLQKYVDCAEKVDNRLKPILDTLPTQ